MMTILGTDDVHIWWRGTEGLEETEMSAAYATLSADERVRREQFYFARDRREYTIAHDLLRRSLSKYDTVAPKDWVFRADERGKPFVSSTSWDKAGSRLGHDSDGGHQRPLSFSLSHTRGLVACAIGVNMPIGVDVERLDAPLDPLELAERCLSQREAAALKRKCGEARALRFLEFWTLKEAFIKATGTGLSQPLSEISFELNPQGVPVLDAAPPGVNPASWRFALYEGLPGTRIAVAAQPHDSRPLEFGLWCA